MTKRHFFISILAMVSAICVVFSGCAATPASGDNNTSKEVDATLGADWDASNTTKIELNGDSASVNGTGATASGSVVTISEAGDYLLSGTLENGQVIVDADKEDTVRLILNGVSITCLTSAPIYVKQADQVIVTLAEEAQNTLTDSENYVFAEGEDEPDAALFSKDDLIINGTGSLTVNASYRNGIASKDDLTIDGGNIAVIAANDGLRGKDSITISAGSFIIDAENDGIKSNNDSETDKGWIIIEDGDFTITAGNDGIQAETELTVRGGTFTIQSGGGAAEAEPKQQQAPGRGGIGRQQPGGVEQDPTAAVQTAVETESELSDTTSTDDSFKGIKAGTKITVSGGSFTINSADDAVHSNGDLLIEGGTFAIATGDDAFHADSNLTIQDGTINISESYEGLEGATVDVNGGEITLKASDDGVNAAGGSDSVGSGRFGPDSFVSGTSYYVRITGGTLTMDASGDGLDSNGDLYLEGGTVVVNGPISGGDSALDYDGKCEVSGGVLIAAGSSGMAQVPSDTSTQSSIMIYFSKSYEAGTAVSLTDTQSNEIVSFTAQKAFQSILFSTPEITQGETYILSIDGETLTEITTSGAVTKVSDDGSTVTGGMGGMGRGGMMDGGMGLGGGTRPQREPGQNGMPEGFPGDLPAEVPVQ